jgi:hypothetical protein
VLAVIVCVEEGAHMKSCFINLGLVVLPMVNILLLEVVLVVVL